VYALYLSFKSPNNIWQIFPSPMYLGLINYFGGIVLSEIKEVV
jgi:predicted CDP-diglyceride synthetase/phosphatidate cytidylyltransferase